MLTMLPTDRQALITTPWNIPATHKQNLVIESKITSLHVRRIIHLYDMNVKMNVKKGVP